MSSKIKDFESAITELESIVKNLDEGNLPLEKSLKLFERGVELSRYCHTQLEAAEQKLEILTERGETATSSDSPSSLDDEGSS